MKKARLVEELQKLITDPSVRNLVEQRIKEFQALKDQKSVSWFEELVFCILTAYSSAEMGLKCVKALKEEDQILGGSVRDVEKTLEGEGYRFPKKRAEYIVSSRKWAKKLREQVLGIGDVSNAREWLVREIKGIGWKEGSHFLRNVGFLDLAILDRHVLRVMSKYSLIKSEIGALTKRKYLEYESVLKDISRQLKMPLGELDLYLWCSETGKVLK